MSPASGPRLTNPDEMLFRQVKETQVEEGHLTWSAFFPFPKDLDELSVSRGSLTTARADFELFTEVCGYNSIGTWGVTVGECEGLGLPSFSDPVVKPCPNPNHAIIDFAGEVSKHSSNNGKKDARKRLANQLTEFAQVRERLYP